MIRPATVLCCLLLATGALAASTPIPLPRDSVYQLRLELKDQHGATWDWQRKRGKPQVVSMFYTSCQYVCPLIVDSGKAIEHALSPAQQNRLGILLISMDPEHDTPAALQEVATRRKLAPVRWALASPHPEDVRAVAALLGVRYRELAGGGFNHSTALVLLDADGRILARTERIGSQADPAFVAAVRQAVTPAAE